MNLIGRPAWGQASVREPAWLVDTCAWLARLYIISWTISFTVFPVLESAIPSLRWLSVGGMLLTGIVSHPRHWERGWTILAFLGVILCTAVVNGSGSDSYFIYIRILAPAVLSFVCGNFDSENRKKIVDCVMQSASVIVISSLLLGLVAPELAFKMVGLERNRLYGMTSHPAMLGYFGSLTACWYGCQCIFCSDRLSAKLRYGLFVCGGIAATVLADSRTGQISIVATPCMIGYVAVLMKSQYKTSIALPYTVLASITLIMIVLPILYAEGVLSVGDDEEKYSTRIELWQTGLEVFAENPLAGNGLASSFYSSDQGANQAPLFYYHTILINYLAKAGIFGGISVVLMLLSAPHAFLRYALCIDQAPQSSHKNHMLCYCASAITTTTIFSTTEASLQSMYPSFLIYFLSFNFLSTWQDDSQKA